MPDNVTRSGRKDILACILNSVVSKLELYDAAWDIKEGTELVWNEEEGEFIEDSEEIEDSEYFMQLTLVISPETQMPEAAICFHKPLKIIKLFGALDGFGIRILRLETGTVSFAEKIAKFDELSCSDENVDAVVNAILSLCK